MAHLAPPLADGHPQLMAVPRQPDGFLEDSSGAPQQRRGAPLRLSGDGTRVSYVAYVACVAYVAYVAYVACVAYVLVCVVAFVAHSGSPRFFVRQAWGAQQTFAYEGGVDSQGRPHGIGVWTDSARTGEVLRGWWRHGVPIGPFRASEQKHGYGFACVRIAFAKNTADGFHDSSWSPRRAEDGVSWGVVSAECSVNGMFFRHLPVAALVAGPEPGRDAAWCIRRLLHLDERQPATSVTLSATTDGALTVEGHVVESETVACTVTRAPSPLDREPSELERSENASDEHELPVTEEDARLLAGATGQWQGARLTMRGCRPAVEVCCEAL